MGELFVSFDPFSPSSLTTVKIICRVTYEIFIIYTHSHTVASDEGQTSVESQPSAIVERRTNLKNRKQEKHHPP
jgi:hypothetical protein